MNEDQLMALVGRLYVGQVIRDNEVRRLRGLLDQYESAARGPLVDDEGDDETQEQENA
jgi:hypothetical protein